MRSGMSTRRCSSAGCGRAEVRSHAAYSRPTQGTISYSKSSREMGTVLMLWTWLLLSGLGHAHRVPPLAHAVEPECEGDHQHAEDDRVRRDDPHDGQGAGARRSEQDNAEQHRYDPGEHQ